MKEGKSLGALRILIADGEQANVDAMGRLCRWWGHEPRLAYDGDQALRSIRLFVPDLALIGVSLPRLNGPGIVRHLRQRGGLKATRFVALVDSPSEHIEQQLKACGFSESLLKPISPLELLTLLVKTRDAKARMRAASALNSRP